MKTIENTRKQTVSALSHANIALPMASPFVGTPVQTVGRGAIRRVPIRD
jgi:hypothetical protein